MKSYALIVNPVSGKGRALRKAEQLQNLLSSSSRVEVLRTTHRGSASELTAAVSGRVDRIIAVGGDGTLNEVVDGLMTARGTSPTIPELGFLPAGTANAAVKAFRLSSSPAWVARALETAESTSLDVGLVSHTGGERAFVLWFGAGWDAVVIHVLNSDRSGQMGVSGLLGHTPRVLRAIREYGEAPIVATVDGAPFGAYSTVIVANVAGIGFGGVVAQMADPGDGHFDVVGVPPLSIPGLLRVGSQVMLSSLTRARGVRHQPGREITLQSEGEVPFHLDGEPVGHLPATARIVAGAVRLLRT